MSLLTLIGEIFKPASDLIDNLHTSDEERLIIKQKMFEVQQAAFIKAQEYETELLKSKTTIIAAEAQGDGWLQKNWRPLMMVWFGVLLGMYWFGVVPENMTQETIDNLFGLLKIGIGGYIVGRSAEKIIPKVKDVMTKD